MALIGFARVSTNDQDLTEQMVALKQHGCIDVFHGMQSGISKDNDAKIDELVRFVRKDDVVLVTKIDRLGRSLRSILRTIERVHEKGATLRSLDGAIDTSNKSPFAQATISLLGSFAQLERDLIVSRTSEGRKRAMKDGVAFGRPPRLSKEQKVKVKKEYSKGRTMDDLAKKYEVSRMTISRVIKHGKND